MAWGKKYHNENKVNNLMQLISLLKEKENLQNIDLDYNEFSVNDENFKHFIKKK